MVTIARSALALLLVSLLPACSGGVAVNAGSSGKGSDNQQNQNPNPGNGTPDAPPLATPSDVPEATDLAYPGSGFIVHEWGTDTVVVGSNGSLQPGLHHEEEDLPAFVYDRIKAGSLEGATSVHVKMETPVTYFYSAEPLKAKVSVAFPMGVLTQWYPAVQSFYPFVVAPNAIAGMTEFKDPALDLDFPFQSQLCSDKHGAIANGLLDWGSVEILGRGEAVAMPEAPLEKFTWSFARDVDANAIRVSGVPGAMAEAQGEKFLFYRGLGNFDLPVRVEALGERDVVATNMLPEKVGTVFVLNVNEEVGGFAAYPQGIEPSGKLAARAPSLEKAMPIDAFVEALAKEVTDALDATGLYHDEAVAMVATWKRQWFKTPGVRVLYLTPQTWTEASIPLAVEPKPEEVVRVMMIRVEVITPELEAADVEQVKMLEGGAQAEQAKGYFVGLGRFAEPRLRRAMELAGAGPTASKLLAEVASAETSVAAGE